MIAEYYSKLFTKPKFEPRTIKWEKKRLANAAEGNVVAIGMSNGFVEPMEANLFAIITNGIWRLVDSIEKNLWKIEGIDWREYNETMSSTYDDIADFILVHYTLSSKFDTPFWKEMRALGQREKHSDLLISKYFSNKNNFLGSATGYSIFPDYMWLQLAVGWEMNISKWPKKNIVNSNLSLVKKFLEKQKSLTLECLDQFPNNYQYLKKNIFNDIPFSEYQNHLK